MHQQEELPEEFYSDENNAPFTHCTVCNEDLIESNVPYSIEKAKKVLATGDEVTLYEMALCMPCSHKMNERVSEHSRKVMQEYFEEIEMEKKQFMSMLNGIDGNWNNQCMITGKPKSEITEFSVVGQFRGVSLIPGMPPFIIDAKAMEGLQDRLSSETKEEFDDFRDKFLSPSDPELRALLQDTSFVFF